MHAEMVEKSEVKIDVFILTCAAVYIRVCSAIFTWIGT